MSLIAMPHTETNWEINWEINAAVQALNSPYYISYRAWTAAFISQFVSQFIYFTTTCTNKCDKWLYSHQQVVKLKHYCSLIQNLPHATTIHSFLSKLLVCIQVTYILLHGKFWIMLKSKNGAQEGFLAAQEPKFS
jgi:hypothetical protein